MVELLNNPEFKRHSEAIPDLHADFMISKELLLGEYRLTRDNAKEIIVSILPKLAVMINTYELNGAGSGQRDEDNEDYGRVDVTQCIDGDDHANFPPPKRIIFYILVAQIGC